MSHNPQAGKMEKRKVGERGKNKHGKLAIIRRAMMHATGGVGRVHTKKWGGGLKPVTLAGAKQEEQQSGGDQD
jgi:hypothetical protein